MERLRLILTTFVAVFSLALVASAQDQPAAAAPADHGKMDHDKHDHDKPASTWKWKSKIDIRSNHHFEGTDISDGANHLFFRGMLGGKASIEDSLHGHISVYGVS